MRHTFDHLHVIESITFAQSCRHQTHSAFCDNVMDCLKNIVAFFFQNFFFWRKYRSKMAEKEGDAAAKKEKKPPIETASWCYRYVRARARRARVCVCVVNQCKDLFLESGT